MCQPVIQVAVEFGVKRSAKLSKSVQVFDSKVSSLDETTVNPQVSGKSDDNKTGSEEDHIQGIHARPPMF
jgi:hypothetical protein